jgi:hypothetical protein
MTDQTFLIAVAQCILALLLIPTGLGLTAYGVVEVCLSGSTRTMEQALNRLACGALMVLLGITTFPLDQL